jgi:GNAT superfamily N-acetyltransferase
VALAIRDATAADADAVAALLGEHGYPSTRAAAGRHIARFADDGASRLQVADGGPGVVGLVATHVLPRLDEDAWSCRITDIVVAAAHRRRGVGTLLLASAETEARRHGAPRLDLTSGDWRGDAHAFYARHGFETRARGFTKRLAPPT